MHRQTNPQQTTKKSPKRTPEQSKTIEHPGTSTAHIPPLIKNELQADFEVLLKTTRPTTTRLHIHLSFCFGLTLHSNPCRHSGSRQNASVFKRERAGGGTGGLCKSANTGVGGLTLTPEESVTQPQVDANHFSESSCLPYLGSFFGA